MIIGIDFDGTIVTHNYPNIGQPVPGAIETIKKLIENGHKVFLWTMRSNKRYNGRDLLTEAIHYCLDNDIELCGANTSPSQWSASPKQYANIYIDDAALGCPLVHTNERPFVNWFKIGELLVKDEYLTEEQFNEIWGNNFF